ncbi:hypothetical protein F4802DRAFT_569423 [Xylaria palmicola]|nr:hypothetical protein F4802DRAFT_569423 [Xylaria palmicola]
MASTSSSDPILFYDIASGPPVRPFAANPWKVRYALNFKRADFATEWVDLSEVASTRKALDADAVRFFGDGEPFYTLPVIKDPATGAVVGDSFDIAVYLDAKYPGGLGLFRGPVGLYAALNAHVDDVFFHGAPLCTGMPLNPATAETSKAEFCRRAGVGTWEELITTGAQRKAIVGAFQARLGETAKLFRFAEGPFLGGREADYADILIGGWLMFMSHASPEWEEIRTWHGGIWGRLHDALEPYRGTW